MTEVDASLPLTGPGGPLTLLDAFASRLAPGLHQHPHHGRPGRLDPRPRMARRRPLSQWPRLAAGHSDDLTS